MNFELNDSCKNYESNLSKGILCTLLPEKPTTENEYKDFELNPEREQKTKRVEKETKNLGSTTELGFFASTKDAVGLGRIVGLFLMVLAEFGFLLDYQKISFFPQLLFIIGLVGLLFGSDLEKKISVLKQEKELKYKINYY